MDNIAFKPIAGNVTVNLAVTASSQTLICSTDNSSTQFRVVNIGTQTVFLAYGTAGTTPVATVSTCIAMVAGSVEVFTFPQNVVLAAIAGNTGSTIYVTPGIGN